MLPTYPTPGALNVNFQVLWNKFTTNPSSVPPGERMLLTLLKEARNDAETLRQRVGELEYQLSKLTAEVKSGNTSVCTPDNDDSSAYGGVQPNIDSGTESLGASAMDGLEKGYRSNNDANRSRKPKER